MDKEMDGFERVIFSRLLRIIFNQHPFLIGQSGRPAVMIAFGYLPGRSSSFPPM